MEPGNALHGKDVVVELDGGRMRHRENKAAVDGKHPKFDAPWREPKLLVIYCVDKNGKKEKDSQVILDATFQGADHAAELLAATLYEYGAEGAKSVTFIADGATCLWDRFAWIVETLKLPASKVSYVLDFFHASHHVSLALSHLGYSDADRRALYKELRHELRQSRWANVVARLEELGGALLQSAHADNARRLSEGEKALPIPLETELNYLRHHGESGHLCYVKFWRRGLPLGSGAVESAIRRVVNLRLKSNGMFWSPENAESILHLRCQVLSTEWSRRRVELYARRLGERSRLWRWSALDRSRSARSVGGKWAFHRRNAAIPRSSRRREPPHNGIAPQLALLRRSFADFTGPELRIMGQKVKKLTVSTTGDIKTVTKTDSATEPTIDLSRVEKVLPLLQKILSGPQS